MNQNFVNIELLGQAIERTLNRAETDVDTRISPTLDENSTNDTLAGSKTIYDFVTAVAAALNHVRMTIVAALPATGETNIIYLIRQGDTSVYKMHAWIDDKWAYLGETSIDLTNYWSKTELQPATTADLDDIFDNM